jgi:hypothetical protein
LNLEAGITIGRNCVALNEREIETTPFPIRIAFSFQVDFSGDQADAYHAIFDVVVIRFIVRG